MCSTQNPLTHPFVPDENRIVIASTNLEYQCSTLGLLVATIELLARYSNAQSMILHAKNYMEFIPKLKVLATLQCQLCLRLARCAFQSQHNLLCGLCLLVENGFCLTTITRLLSVITTLSLSEQRSLIQHVNSNVFEISIEYCTFPALYWVTLCWVCFRQSLPLQYVRRVFGTLTWGKEMSVSIKSARIPLLQRFSIWPSLHSTHHRQLFQISIF